MEKEKCKVYVTIWDSFYSFNSRIFSDLRYELRRKENNK